MAHIPPGTTGQPSVDTAIRSPTATAEAGLAQHTESPRALHHTQSSALSLGPLSLKEEHARSLSRCHQTQPGSLPFEGLRRHQIRGPLRSLRWTENLCLMVPEAQGEGLAIRLGQKGDRIAAGSRTI